MWHWMKSICPAGSRGTRLLLPILAVLTLSVATAPRAFPADPPADEPSPPTDDSKKKPQSYGDEDLEKYHKPKPGTPAPAAPPAAAPPASQPAAAPGRPSSPAVPATGTPKGAAAPAPGAKPAAVGKPVSSTPKPPAPTPSATTFAPPRPAPPATPGSAQDPLKPWKDKEARSDFRQKQIQDLRDRIAALQGRLDYLNLKRLAILDPLRVMPKPQTEDDRSADAQKGSRDLLASVDEEIKGAEAEMAQAKEDLLTIETRFAQETGNP